MLFPKSPILFPIMDAQPFCQKRGDEKYIGALDGRAGTVISWLSITFIDHKAIAIGFILWICEG
jgi:hypothetical protein